MSRTAETFQKPFWLCRGHLSEAILALQQRASWPAAAAAVAVVAVIAVVAVVAVVVAVVVVVVAAA